MPNPQNTNLETFSPGKQLNKITTKLPQVGQSNIPNNGAKPLECNSPTNIQPRMPLNRHPSTRMNVVEVTQPTNLNTQPNVDLDELENSKNEVEKNQNTYKSLVSEHNQEPSRDLDSLSYASSSIEKNLNQINPKESPIRYRKQFEMENTLKLDVESAGSLSPWKIDQSKLSPPAINEVNNLT